MPENKAQRDIAVDQLHASRDQLGAVQDFISLAGSLCGDQKDVESFLTNASGHVAKALKDIQSALVLLEGAWR